MKKIIKTKDKYKRTNPVQLKKETDWKRIWKSINFSRPISGSKKSKSAVNLINIDRRRI